MRDRIGDVARLDWERLYSGGETDYFHAATMPGDGSLVRARVDPATSQLLVQRVVDPGPGKDFAVWSSFATVSSNAGIALASDGANVLLFYVDTDNVTIKLAESSDYGQSFGSAVTVATASGAVGRLAADLKSDGTALLLYSVGATVYRVKRASGVWGSPAAWTNSLAGVTGLACCYAIDFNVVVTGTDSSGAAKVWTTIYGDGFNHPLDTWSPLTELARADAGSNMTFRAPFLDRADVPRLFFVEKYTGSQAYSRPLWTHVCPIQRLRLEHLARAGALRHGSEYGVGDQPQLQPRLALDARRRLAGALSSARRWTSARTCWSCARRSRRSTGACASSCATTTAATPTSAAPRNAVIRRGAADRRQPRLPDQPGATCLHRPPLLDRGLGVRQQRRWRRP